VSLATDEVRRAYQACEALARSHYENFPVASRLLPPAMRSHIVAVYAFARIADDIADEGTAPAAARLAALDRWRTLVHRAALGEGAAPRPPDDRRPDDDRDALVAAAVGHSIRSLDLPITLFDDLLSAFGQDTMTSRYASWAEVFDYCRRSANPIGRLVLRIAGYRDERLDRSSDALCTALQLTNFWQDFGRDWRAGRLYVPREVQESCGAAEEALAHGPLTAGWARAIAECVDRTRALFEEGRSICDAVTGRLRLELRLTWLGGRRILDRVDRMRPALLDARPALGARDAPVLAWRAACWGFGRVRDGHGA
jgi:squalene synthase HpnC